MTWPALSTYSVSLKPRINLRIKSGLESVKRVPGRFEQLDTLEGVRVVVDFAHSPDSLAKMLGFLKQHYTRMIVVFGCGGSPTLTNVR